MQEEEIEPGFYKELFADDDLFLLEEGAPELKEVCIILDKKLSAKNETFLSKILTAVNLSLYNTSILYTENVPSASALKTRTVLIFDDVSKEPGDLYSSFTSGDVTILKCNSLDPIGADKTLKGKLWIELQKIFLK